MSNKIVIVTDERINTYLDSIGNKLTQAHRNQFIEICKGFNLDPFKREIYGVAYGNNFNIIMGYEVFIKRAEYSGQLSGWRSWTEKDGNDMKACIEIKRKDWESPFYHEVYLDEYNQNNQMWKTKTRTMLKKVAIGQGFRMCFSVDLGGLPYIEAEIDTIKTKDVTPIKNTATANAYASIVDKKVEPKEVKLLKQYLYAKGINNKETFESFLKFTDLDINNIDQVGALNSNNKMLDDLIREFNAN